MGGGVVGPVAMQHGSPAESRYGSGQVPSQAIRHVPSRHVGLPKRRTTLLNSSEDADSAPEIIVATAKLRKSTCVYVFMIIS